MEEEKKDQHLEQNEGAESNTAEKTEEKAEERKTFRDFGLDDGLVTGLDIMGFKNPTPIQEKSMPHILAGKDVIGCAQTGTGKTAAFVLPILHKITAEKLSGTFNTLIICPTRELAKQIDQQVEGLSYYVPVSSFPIYGGSTGSEFIRQKNAITSGTEIIVGTPGKLKAHLNLGYVKTESIKHLILDEADRMLDMGFFEDIISIINHLPKVRQTLLFSATMPNDIRKLAQQILVDPVSVTIAISKIASGVDQSIYRCYDTQKDRLLTKILSDKEWNSVIVFCSTKKAVKELYQKLRKKSLSVEMIQSDMEQVERERIMLDFRNRTCKILVATDVVSRGIDVTNIEMVINHSVPQDAEDYVHRVGRTARAETTGIAITLVNPDDNRRLDKIEKLIGLKLTEQKLPEELGEGPKPGERGRGGRGGRGGGHRGGGGRGGSNRGKGRGGSGNYRGKRGSGGNRSSNSSGGGKKKYYSKKKGGSGGSNSGGGQKKT